MSRSLTLSDADLARIRRESAHYSNGLLNRHDFLQRLAQFTRSMAATHLTLEKAGLTQVISPEETAQSGVTAHDVTYGGDELPNGGYLAQPQSDGPFPAILVIHENRGLNEHTRDVARRFAAAGFVALAPDALVRFGGTAKFSTPDEAREAIGALTLDQALADLEAGLAYLESLPQVKADSLASIGFCWGGARSFALATQSQRLKAAAVFYGSAPGEDRLGALRVPVLGIYGELDSRITEAVLGVAQTLEAAGKSFDYKIYEGAEHAFFNDHGPRYNSDAAADAWQRTLQFLQAKLG